jgi:erythromycin esterase
MKLSDEAVIPLSTLDPAAPLDDLGWLDRVVGDARVVAIGESSHYNHEFLRLRHRLIRHLVEREGFGAVAMETGFVEGWLIDGWIGGGTGDLAHVMANGLTSLMGLWTETRALLEWLREHPVRFYGIDLGGSNVSWSSRASGRRRPPSRPGRRSASPRQWPATRASPPSAGTR